MTTTTEITPADNLVTWVERSKPGLRRLGVDADRFTRILATQIRSTPRLAECTPESVMGAMYTAAELGIDPGGSKGHCWLIPRRIKGTWECTFMLGYTGMIDLAYRESDVVITVGAVHTGDRFRERGGTDPGIDHEPARDSNRDDPTDVTHVYAVAHFPNGAKVHRVLPRAEVERRRHAGGSGDSDAWGKHWLAMALKTSIRALWSHIPKGTTLAMADAADEAVVAPDELRAAADAATPDGPPDVEHLETVRDTPTDDLPPAGDHLPAEFVLEVEQLRLDAGLADDAAFVGWLVDVTDGGAADLDGIDPDHCPRILDALRVKAAG